MTAQPLSLITEKLRFVECISAGYQKPGHVGVSAPIYSLVRFEMVDSTGTISMDVNNVLRSAMSWLKFEEHNPYVSITAHIDNVEELYEFHDAVKNLEFRKTMTMSAPRYTTLYLKDEPLVVTDV